MSDTSMPKEAHQLVSVVIPCYNSERYLRETVESVFRQTYRNIELICVDDGSTDTTKEILYGYGSRIRVLEHPDVKNKGEYASYNLGIRSSRGDFIALLDHDDLWSRDKIEVQVHFLNDHEDTDVVYCNGYLINSFGVNIGQHLSADHKETNNPDILILKNYVAPSGALIRKRVFEKIGCFSESYLGGDHDFFARVSEAGRLGYVDKKLFSRRIHPGQISKNRRLREEAFSILRAARARYPYSITAVRKRKASIHYGLGEHDYMHGYVLRAMYHFALAACYDLRKGLKGREVWMDLLLRRSGQQ